MEKLNAANREAKPGAERKRIPMSVPVQKLEVPEIPGYHLHWFRGDPARIQRAQDGGYEFVDERESKINAVSLGGNSAQSGNTDMGSRVSIVSGDEIGHDGQPSRLILMKIKQEWYNEDQLLVDEKNERVAAALRGGEIGGDMAADKNELGHRYVGSRTKIPDLFNPKRPKAV